jgi:SAM-dependent methyltransferase
MESDSQWFSQAFDTDYLERYAHRDEEEARLGCRLALEATGLQQPARVLDLACGAGRHLEALARLGFEVTGGDLSLPLLRYVCRRAPQGKFVPRVARLDMRRLPFPSATFAMVVNFFTAFGYFEKDEENFGVFGEVRRVLRPGGWFVFDFLNSETARAGLAAEPVIEYQHMPDGTVWEIQKQLSANRERALKVQRKLRDGSILREVHECIRLFDPQTIAAEFEKNQLETTAVYGDYDGSPFQPGTSPRLISIARAIP